MSAVAVTAAVESRGVQAAPDARSCGLPQIRLLHLGGTVLSAEDRFAIKALHNEWLNAELRRDTAAMLQLSTAAPIWLPPNEAPLCGRAAILGWLEDQPDATVRSIDIDDLAISGIGPFAWKLATFRTTFGDPANRGVGVVTGTHGWLLQRDDSGTWRIAVVTWTATAA